MSPVTSSSIPGAVSAVTRAKAASDNPAANVLLSVYGSVPIGADGLVLTADSTNPLGVSWSAPASTSVAGRATRGTGQVIPNTTFTAISFDTEAFDTANVVNIGANPTRLTAPVSGIYLATAIVGWSAGSSGIRQLYTRINGVTYGVTHASATQTPSDGFAWTQPISHPIQLAAGDYVEVVVYQDSGGSVTTDVNPCPHEGALVKVA